MMSREAFVQQFQKQLAQKFSHGYQSWWHRFIFHFSDISNMSSALNGGKLYSRNRAMALGLMKNDNASDEVIGNTNFNAKDFVRFYFGTLTPTQFHNEGFKPKSKIQNNAHCPLPVFLLFDFVKLLSHEQSHFSSGNMAVSNVDIYHNIQDLERLEFEYIYHRSPILEPLNKRHVIYCRHAEVLIPDELKIYDYLSYICVRSQAERETLLFTLSATQCEQLIDKVLVRTTGLFHPNRLYVERVQLLNARFSIVFSMATHEKYVMNVTVVNHDTGATWKHNTDEISLESKEVFIDLKPKYIGSCVEIRLEIDGHLAYANSFDADDELIF